MGVQTEYLGHIEIEPSLTLREISYLSAFSRSRRCGCSGRPYGVPELGANHVGAEKSTDRCNRMAKGQPSLWCQWVPCPTGCCLAWDGREKFYAGTAWLQYLIDHFLRPGAEASKTSQRQFTGFTFDHQLNGVIAGCQLDNRELFLIRVEDNDVTRDVLRPGDPMPWDLPYYDDRYYPTAEELTAEEEGRASVTPLPARPGRKP